MASPKYRRILGNQDDAGSLQAGQEVYLATGSDIDIRDTSQSPSAGVATCPICDESIALAALNLHIDFQHGERLEKEAKSNARSWLQQLTRGTKSNPAVARGTSRIAPGDLQISGEHQSGFETNSDTEAGVSRSHWQRETSSAKCSFSGCGKTLGGYRNKQINCRLCGKLFCHEHTQYQMRLSRLARYEPANGVWCRVCATCYQARAWYNDNTGAETEKFKEFCHLRGRTVARLHLERNRLEKRLTKLLNGLSAVNSADQAAYSSIWSIVTGGRAERLAVEQEVTEWEDESKVTSCPYCQQLFSFSLRKHHCRLCGKITCGSPQPACSTITGFKTDGAGLANSPRLIATTIDVRICRSCHTSLFESVELHNDIAAESQCDRLYSTLQQYRSALDGLIPRFHALFESLNSKSLTPSKSDLTEGRRVRKRLLEAFAQYDQTAKKIGGIRTRSKTQKTLQEAICRHATMFLQLHMIPLQAVPTLQNREDGKLGTQSKGHEKSQQQDALEAQQQEHLMIFREQEFLLTELLQSAAQRRRFEEVQVLRQSLKELGSEIARKEQELSLAN